MDAALGSRILNEVRGESLEEVRTKLPQTMTPPTPKPSQNDHNHPPTKKKRKKGIILGSIRNAYHQGTAQERVSAINYKIKTTGMHELDDIVAQHFRSTKIGGLAVTGRYLPLMYKIASTLASAPNNKAIIIIDYEGRFRASGLTCNEDDLEHIYVLRPPENTRDQPRDNIIETENYILFNDRARHSACRELWGTIVLGGVAGGDITAGWRGWLRVDREEVQPFPPDTSIEEALRQREKRQRAVDAAGWQASSAWGGFVFHDSRT
ncbi:hypothetical protein LLEC1_00322 [Akanthomyces lecanii]|uniref:Uncharacterized protein n=1 Tax=Cordyceps confragosa TaxID=2714763 RepID=A0A179IJP8_CORDF|nr:hypothetical protein LLEC1_00322 [Akanthomyces lecanii]